MIFTVDTATATHGCDKCAGKELDTVLADGGAYLCEPHLALMRVLLPSMSEITLLFDSRDEGR